MELAVGSERELRARASGQPHALVVRAAIRIRPAHLHRAALRRDRTLAGHDPRVPELELDGLIGPRVHAHHGRRVLRTHPRIAALPADRGRTAGREQERAGQRVQTVASSPQMARRRNHGVRTPAAELAEKAIASIVPRHRLAALRVQLAWPDAVPRHLVRVAMPVAFDGTTLVIHTIDNQWLHELTYLRADLLSRLREHLPGMDIGALKIRVGEVPPPLPPPPVERVAPSIVLPMQPARETLDAIAEIEDPGLRSAVATARQALTKVKRG